MCKYVHVVANLIQISPTSCNMVDGINLLLLLLNHLGAYVRYMRTYRVLSRFASLRTAYGCRSLRSPLSPACASLCRPNVRLHLHVGIGFGLKPFFGSLPNAIVPPTFGRVVWLVCCLEGHYFFGLGFYNRLLDDLGLKLPFIDSFE